MGERGVTGSLAAGGLKFAVVVARYNGDVSERLLDGALGALAKHGAPDSHVEVFHVPGSLEIPVATMRLARSGRFDAIVCLGCVIKGETAHFDFVAGECAAGVMRVSLDTGVPCAFGVLTTYTREQALARSATEDNKGAEAAETAIEMANLLLKHAR